MTEVRGVLVRKRLTITGVVQGVGFRPFIWRRATALGLSGWVENESGGVIAEVQGENDTVAAFITGLAAAAPPLAVVEHVAVAEGSPVAPEAAFEIRASAARFGRSTPLPPDIATCDACRAEVADPADRRRGYPFTNCTDCGPRYTIITDLPYDRATTTMRPFEMCAACAAEYDDPASRRFHAQPNACPECGPTVWLCRSDAVAVERTAARLVGDAAIEAARDVLRGGEILAVKGLGGFHLACDATNPAGVARLRDRKRRVGKPLAVMVADVAAARAIAEVGSDEADLLESRERPIVLLRPRCAASGSDPVTAAVSPGNDFIGVLLPYAPLHELLCRGMPPLVMTSGNVSEEPIVHDNVAAARVLAPLADALLIHDRDIHLACDDSVVRRMAGGVVPIRRSRGYAPLPIALGGPGPNVLAVGGELKATLCITHADQAFMSQHLGDMGNVETLDALAHTAEHLLRLFRVEPTAVVADLHPGYLSTDWARRFAAARGIPLVQVQHHEAHVAALRAEARIDEAAPMIGVCFDGTGYAPGEPAQIWGGEFFSGPEGDMQRAAHLEPFLLPGGDASIRQPWRVALAVLQAAGVPWDERLPSVAAAHGADILRRQLERQINCVATTSMGRLFDAVASLIGTRHDNSYEAEAALNLESLAARGDTPSRYTFGVVDEGLPLRIDWRPVIAAIAADVLAGVSPARIAAGFHDAVAAMTMEVCGRLRQAGAGDRVGLTGGVFQNAVLTEQAAAGLAVAGFRVVLHRLVPPNDGGLALGQAVLGRMRRAAVTP
ncbi:MAG: carbamoyltransferase HypF [Pirellulales bacterium]